MMELDEIIREMQIAAKDVENLLVDGTDTAIKAAEARLFVFADLLNNELDKRIDQASESAEDQVGESAEDQADESAKNQERESGI